MTKPKKFRFTKKAILALPSPEKSMTTYFDDKEKGLCLYITKTGVITFFVRKRINGKDERVTLGQFPNITIENARKLALKVKSDVATGVDPIAEKRRITQEMTFKALFDEYMERFSKKHKRSWKYDEREVNKFLPHWFKRKISTITKQQVQLLHEKIREENGLYQANRLLERIRAIFNKAIDWGWEGTNPATGIKKFREKSRDRFVQPYELPCLFQAMEQEESEVARDYFYMSLLTGARKSNILAMRWEQINWNLKEWRIPVTKNEDPLTVPLTERAIAILEERRKKTNSEWVFPSPSMRSKTGHLADPKKAWKRTLQRATILLWSEIEDFTPYIQPILDTTTPETHIYHLFEDVIAVLKNSKLTPPTGLMDIRLHDLRRTVGSYQAITGASLPIIGKSLGHKSQQATQIYSRLNLDPVRASMEKATDSMFGLTKDKSQ